MWWESVEREGVMRGRRKGGCGSLLGIEYLEREGEGRGLALVEKAIANNQK